MLKISKNVHQQRGAAAVEFAIVAMLLFILLFGLVEFGRLFYVFNTVQEVTRRAAREATVRWVDGEADAKWLALFGGGSLPAYAEITAGDITIDYLSAINPDVIIPRADLISKEDNITACLDKAARCITFVRVSIADITYAPMIGLFSGVKVTAFPFSDDNPFKLDFKIPIPASTVTMPAESLGYRG
jgi:hypothetical protein